MSSAAVVIGALRVKMKFYLELTSNTIMYMTGMLLAASEIDSVNETSYCETGQIG